jgi:hypothetical protein
MVAHLSREAYLARTVSPTALCVSAEVVVEADDIVFIKTAHRYLDEHASLS